MKRRYCLHHTTTLEILKHKYPELNICYSSMRFNGEPLVVSCERTVSVGGGLVKDAGMVFNQRTGCRTSLFVYKPAPADLGPGTGHHQGRALGQRAAQSDRKPGMLMANIQILNNCIEIDKNG